jgi:hypothetical protein
MSSVHLFDSDESAVTVAAGDTISREGEPGD